MLPPCPDSPNCVSSLENGDHQIDALAGQGSRAASLSALAAALDSLPRVDWQQVGDDRIEATFTSLVFRFVDDVVFVIHEDGRIDVRSASRVGHYDFGANRKRVEMLRDMLNQ
ncbi:MAG: DUF1499 domain-containing protein [Alcanivoracaceae bacterium]|nr:DUF1499 domain-containing protein [Alcanivoracaceae bacterium]